MLKGNTACYGNYGHNPYNVGHRTMVIDAYKYPNAYYQWNIKLVKWTRFSIFIGVAPSKNVSDKQIYWKNKFGCYGLYTSYDGWRTRCVFMNLVTRSQMKI